MKSFVKPFYIVAAATFFNSQFMPAQNPVLYQNSAFSVTSQGVQEGQYTATVHDLGHISSNYAAQQREWRLSRTASDLPQFSADIPLAEALYNMSLEEMLLNIRQDSAFMAGAKWEGVWTRDISYSIHLALAAIAPATAKTSLLRKVQNGIIIQDTGSGGSYPISTDRMTWALAAWEVYVVTGDQEWLKQAYSIIRKSAMQDLSVALDKSTGLFLGESSFLDWREQSYPTWMEPKDIYESKCLGTNVVHYQTYRILEKMATLLGEPTNEYKLVANNLHTAINKHLWVENKNYYGQFLYGSPYSSLSPRSEALGEALSVLFGVATEERKQQVIANTPVLNYGVPCFYPQIGNIPPYHNNAIWPFVQSYFTWAAAKAGNEAVVQHGIASVYRQAALFLTNKENMVAQTGNFEGTAINSDRQLWSVAGNLAMVYRVFFGMDFQENELVFSPFVPQSFIGTKTLKNFRYRNCTLNITVKGYGSQIKSFTVDGTTLKKPVIPSSFIGQHDIVIELSNESLPKSQINLVKNQFSMATPELHKAGNSEIYAVIKDKVEQVPAAILVYKNGVLQATIHKSNYDLPKVIKECSVYQVKLLGTDGVETFLSQPIIIAPVEIAVLPQQNDVDDGIPALENVEGSRMALEATIPYKGKYILDFYYINANGPINTDNKCAIRTIYLQDLKKGHIVFPQRGEGAAATYGYSNQVIIDIPQAGKYHFYLEYSALDQNMNGTVNTAIIQKGRLIKIN
jgi:hypothetical protein